MRRLSNSKIEFSYMEVVQGQIHNLSFGGAGGGAAGRGSVQRH